MVTSTAKRQAAMDPATLQWVQGDIEQTLTLAREALERFAENPGATQHMRSCADALHAVHGVLEMLEYYGACLLLEEMENVSSELLRGETDTRVEGCELLLRSILQLTEYLNYLRSGHQDTPTIFMPLLNDLRCLRGEPLLSENALFAPDLGAPIPLEDHGYQLDDAQVREIGRRLRAYYQKGLLDWYQGTVDGGGLALMQAVVLRCEKLCGAEPFARLWWIAAGVIEALKESALEPSVAVRRLLALLDKQLKRIAAGGKAVLAESPDPDLVKNLLYYVARSSSSAERVTAIREIFALDDLFVGEDASRRAQRILCGPDLDSLKVVAAGIREDLNGVKSSLDAFVRKGSAVSAELGPVADRLRRVADTLGLLNLGRSRKRVAAQVEQLRRLAEGPAPPSIVELMAVASDLLHIDATLDSISRQGLTEVTDSDSVDEAAPEPDRGDTELTSIEYLRLVTAVVGEATTELADIKHAISEYLREPGARDILTEINRHVKVVEGSLRMLSLERAADLLRDWGQCACELLGLSRPPSGTLDALADALVSLEYYLESVVGLQPNVHALLGFTEDCIRSLEQTVVENAARGPAPEPEAGAEAHALEVEPAPRLLEVDDDILQVFIDEAREVIQVLDEHVPRWIADPADRDALVTTRRAFHTLKGSGRLVGALDLGEYAWSVENLLNRVIEGICPASRSVVELVTEAYHALPDFVDALEQRRATSIDVDGFAVRARDIVEQHESTVPYEGEDAEAGAALELEEQAEERAGEVEIEAAPEPAPRDAAPASAEATPAGAGAEIAPEPDDTRRVFVDEATRILEFCASIIAHWRNAPNDRGFVKELQRELHTLKGGARTAGISDMADLSHAMESVLLIVSDGHLTPSPELLDLMDDCQDRLVELVEGTRGQRATEPVEDLITRMDELVCPGISTVADAVEGDARASQPPPGAAAHAGNGRLGAMDRGERIQISAEFLDNMADYAGELSISHSRFGQQVGSFKYNLDEMSHTIERLRDQIRRLEMETESQIPASEDEDEDDESIEPFDPLEMDRFSRVQQLSRALLETVSDLESIQQSLGVVAQESDAILAEQSRVNKDLQQGLMRTRMTPFASQVQRYRRLVRRTMTELGKRVELLVEGEEIRLDRTILERITPSIEHVLRNAVDHGVERPAARKQLGKPETATIKIA
ncbi:MAG: Hpt domain-containing protein, partial [Gammaproteobacteria bacterium]|nr:Hpt domain-containing protein [Gammaproteobacteria bacterium]